MKVLLTGGHIAPAYAVAEEFLKHKHVELLFVGRLHATKGEKYTSFEYDQIHKLSLKFIPFESGKFTRAIPLSFIINLIYVVLGFFSSIKLLRKNKPDVILSFGGYIAFPICFCGYLLGIPIYTHEQTIIPGLSNRLIALFAKKIFISFGSTKKYFAENKVVISGNPIRKSLLQIHKSSLPFKYDGAKPILLILGGSIGSASVNSHVFAIIKQLSSTFHIYHQVGNVSYTGDWEKCSRIRLNEYHPVKHFQPDEIASLYNQSALVVARSGANTICELIHFEKPAVLIPLPFSSRSEQQKHAELLQSKGVCEIFNQEDASTQLLELIAKVYKERKEYKDNYKNLKYLIKLNSAEIIVNTVLETHGPV